MADILLVDDHPLIRDGLRAVFSSHDDLHVCGEAAGVEEALRLAKETQPDLAVVDINLTDGNGLELLRQLQEQCPTVKVLVLSVYDEVLYAERVLKAGAWGYVQKSESSNVLVPAIRRVLGGARYISERVNELILSNMTGGHTGGDRDLPSSMSNRELQVFELIANGCTQREIADRMGIALKTVNTYRDNLRAHFDLSNSAQLTRLAIEWRMVGRFPEPSAT